MLAINHCNKHGSVNCTKCNKTANVNGSPELAGCTLSNSSHTQLCEYLIGHEYDIATETNDFGYLADIFKELLKRKPTAK